MIAPRIILYLHTNISFIASCGKLQIKVGAASQTPFKSHENLLHAYLTAGYLIYVHHTEINFP